MRISEIVWDEEAVIHIAKHGVEPEEVEEACFDDPLIRRGRQGLYYVLGRSRGGRYLFMVFKLLGRGQARVITARDMTRSEKRYFKKVKER